MNFKATLSDMIKNKKEFNHKKMWKIQQKYNISTHSPPAVLITTQSLRFLFKTGNSQACSMFSVRGAYYCVFYCCD